MRVTLCVDALQPQLSGIGRYTWELCKGLRGRPEISSLKFHRGNILVDDPGKLLNREHYPPRNPKIARWWRRQRAKRELGSSIVHGPNYFLPDDADTGIITVHDLSVLRYPEMHPESRLKSFERLFASSVNRVSHVITDTETIRREVIEMLSLPENSVTAVPLGVSPSFHPMDARELAATLARWSLLPGSYGLSVAAFEPRKKLGELIAAWAQLPRRLRNECPLVLAGASGWRNDSLHESIAKAEAEGWLRNLGFVDESRLPELYAGARLFIYPSIYEGFGLPPVEAMASGIPVIVSNQSCLSEVCGEAARAIDPDNIVTFALAIEESLTDDVWRSEARKRGLDRSKLYSWERCVVDTVAIYRKVTHLNEPNRGRAEPW